MRVEASTLFGEISLPRNSHFGDEEAENSLFISRG